MKLFPSSGFAARLRRLGAKLLLAGLPALLLAACTPVKPFVPQTSQMAHGEGRLWQVEGPGIQASYVFATFDLPHKQVLDLPPKAEAAFEESQILALEGVGDPYLKDEIYTKENLEMADGQTLEDLIGSRSYGILRWHMKQSQRLPNDNVKPWVMWAHLGGENFGFTEHRYYKNRAYEFQVARLETRANNADKKVVGLMTEQEYFDIYDKMPLDQQADMLKLRLERYSEGPLRATRADYYLAGDLASLDALWREYLSWLQPATAETLDRRRIVERSQAMAERMVPLMRENVTFVAIDTLFLPGESGVLRRLEQQGFTVTRLE